MSTPNSNVVILGAGGLGREVLWGLSHTEAVVRDVAGIVYRPEVLGFLDDNTGNLGQLVNDVPILGGSDWLADQPHTLVVVAVGSPSVRAGVVEQLRKKKVRCASFVSPRSIVGNNNQLGEGIIILPGAVVTTNVQLGDFVILNPHVSVSHDCVVGDYSSLGPGVSLAGNVHIGASSDIGTNASVIPGVHIGGNTVIGAGACVTRDLPDNVTAVGVPAKVMK